jgi:hypothetical protein
MTDMRFPGKLIYGSAKRPFRASPLTDEELARFLIDNSDPLVADTLRDDPDLLLRLAESIRESDKALDSNPLILTREFWNFAPVMPNYSDIVTVCQSKEGHDKKRIGLDCVKHSKRKEEYAEIFSQFFENVNAAYGYATRRMRTAGFHEAEITLQGLERLVDTFQPTPLIVVHTDSGRQQDISGGIISAALKCYDIRYEINTPQGSVCIETHGKLNTHAPQILGELMLQSLVHLAYVTSGYSKEKIDEVLGVFCVDGDLGQDLRIDPLDIMDRLRDTIGR